MEHTKQELENPDVAEIMEQIRSRIEAKKKAGQYSPEELDRIERMTLEIQTEGSEPQEGDILYQLSQVNYLCDTRKLPELSSHRQALGTLVSGVKKFFFKLTEPYIQMVLKRQVEFNVELVRLINHLALDIRYRSSNQEKQLALLEKRWAEMTQSLEAIPQELRTQKNVFEEILSQLKAIKVSSEELGPELDKLQTKVREPEYVRFEDRHRGSLEDIKWKQKSYLGYFKNKGTVLDIGCGRGEFLELLKEVLIPALGIDLNQEMIRQCQTKGLQAIHGDGLVYLKGVEDNSLGGIFLSQVIEHLQPEALRELVRVSLAKLVPGGVLLAETINPQCLTTFSGAFYLDLSHNNPIHPEAARFLWESLGFRQVDLLFVSPYPEEMKLKEMVRRNDDSYEDEMARINNENVTSLNALLYGYQDYAVLGYK
jgi:O-antigen chain-terminating methyltransferase